MSEINPEAMPPLDPASVADEIKKAAHELYDADLACDDARSLYELAKKRRHEADLAMTRIAPWNKRALHFDISLSPVDRAVIRIEGDPAESGHDCSVLAVYSIEAIAEAKCEIANSRPSLDDLPF